MPTTRPRKLNVGGVEFSVALDRLLAERVKSQPVLRRLAHNPALRAHRGGEPDVSGLRMEDIHWYQTIELGDGRVTPGYVDHRAQVDSYGLPASLSGLRCLDVATADGFWAFEMERRGAAEVVACDVHSRADYDFPRNFEAEYLRAMPPDIVTGLGFAFARRARGSRVRRRVLSVYELTPRRVGTFDVVFISDVLIHLRDPLAALEAAWRVTRPGGLVVVAELYDARGTEEDLPALRYVLSMDEFSGLHWWLPNPPALKLMLSHARFEEVREVGRIGLDTGPQLGQPKIVFNATRGSGGA